MAPFRSKEMCFNGCIQEILHILHLFTLLLLSHKVYSISQLFILYLQWVFRASSYLFIIYISLELKPLLWFREMLVILNLIKHNLTSHYEPLVFCKNVDGNVSSVLLAKSNTVIKMGFTVPMPKWFILTGNLDEFTLLTWSSGHFFNLSWARITKVIWFAKPCLPINKITRELVRFWVSSSTCVFAWFVFCPHTPVAPSVKVLA